MKSKNYFFFNLIIFFIVAFSVSCSDDFEVNETSQFMLCDAGSSLVLEFRGTESNIYKWYECSDIDGNIIKYLTENDCSFFETEKFNSPEIRYYKCVGYDSYGNIKENSAVYCVGCTGLPTLSIKTEDGKEVTSKKDYKKADITISSSDSTYILNNKEILIKGRGSSSWFASPKKGFNIKFDNKESILGMAKGKKWCLIPNFKDNTHLANWYAFYLANAVFVNEIKDSVYQWQPSAQIVDLVINGDYRGTYTLSEAIKINGERIDIKDISELEKTKKTLDKGGFVLEICDTPEQYSFCTLHGLNITFKDPDLESIEGTYTAEEIKEYVRKKVNRLEAAIFRESSDDYKELIDLQSLVNWYLINEFMCNQEASFKTSCYFYFDPKLNKFYMGPVWDFDRGFCSGNATKTDNVLVKDNNTWFNELLKDNEFIEMVKETWESKKNDLYASIEIVSNYSDVVSVSRTMNSQKWLVNDCSTAQIQDWITQRIEFMDKEFIRNL